MADTMKAVRIHAHGGREVLRLDDVPRPEPGPGELLVRVTAAGVNFRDVYQREGVVPVTLPHTLGLEAAGTIEKVGPPAEGAEEDGVADPSGEFSSGQRAALGMGKGGYAEYVLMPAERAVPLPDDIDDRTATAVLLQGLTAHYLSHDTFPLAPGQRCLVHSGAGGVGRLLIQIAKQRGAEVLTTVSTEAKGDLARASGADHVILYTQTDFAAEVKARTGGVGVDVVYDGVGADTFEKSLDSLKRRGMLVLYGQSSGLVPPFNLYQLSDRGSLFVTRPHLMHHIYTRAELLERSAALFALVRQGALQVHIGGEYPLANAAEAHQALEGRQTSGKLLLIP